MTLEYGQCEWTPFVDAASAKLLSAYGDVGLDRTFVALNLDLLAMRSHSDQVLPRTNFIVFTFANHFSQPLIHSLEPFLDAHRMGLETGELAYGPWP